MHCALYVNNGLQEHAVLHLKYRIQFCRCPSHEEVDLEGATLRQLHLHIVFSVYFNTNMNLKLCSLLLKLNVKVVFDHSNG